MMINVLMGWGTEWHNMRKKPFDSLRPLNVKKSYRKVVSWRKEQPGLLPAPDYE
jgi:hypothetical protein